MWVPSLLLLACCQLDGVNCCSTSLLLRSQILQIPSNPADTNVFWSLLLTTFTDPL